MYPRMGAISRFWVSLIMCAGGEYRDAGPGSITCTKSPPGRSGSRPGGWTWRPITLSAGSN